MKNFLTSLLGSLVALLIFVGGGILLMIGILGAIVAMAGKKTPGIESNSYLVFDLATNITDAPPLVDFGDLGDGRNETLQLRAVTRGLRRAATDPRIKGVLLIGTLSPSGYGSGYAALREVRAALGAVRDAHKPVKAYMDFATTKDYYLASAASNVILNPYGMIYMPGLASEPMFYAGAFEKYGVGVQVTRVGKYKSYVEPFIRKDMSPENREQIQKLLGDVWGDLVSEVGVSRNVTPARIQATVDSEGLIRPEAARAAHLIDRTAYRDELEAELKAETGVTEPKESFHEITLAHYIKAPADVVGKSGSKVAVVYAEGDIVDGEGEDDSVGGLKYAREIRELREDPSVRAIVLRVNSPGGSATAAEDIQREVVLARKVKPVVVSMGSYAASGGYWISAYGDRIFAEPTTITGSIGVFGIQFDVQKLANNLGLTFDSVKTGKFADSITITRPKTPEEMDVFQRMVDWIYGQFIAKVAEGRHLKPEFVQEIAQGRVWSGTEARKLGLVDEIGGLDAAIKFAAKRANLGPAYRVVEYPQTKELAEAIAEMLGKIAPTGLHVRTSGWMREVERRIETEFGHLRSFNDPVGIYARMPADLAIH